MSEQEINDLLKVEAAYNKKGEFIGLALATNTNGQTGNVLVFNDAGFSGFRVGRQFVCGPDDEIRYEELELVNKRSSKN